MILIAVTLLLLTISTNAQSAQDFCANREGVYCSSDASSFYFCVRSGTSSLVPCPSNYTCSCPSGVCSSYPCQEVSSPSTLPVIPNVFIATRQISSINTVGSSSSLQNATDTLQYSQPLGLEFADRFITTTSPSGFSQTDEYFIWTIRNPDGSATQYTQSVETSRCFSQSCLIAVPSYYTLLSSNPTSLTFGFNSGLSSLGRFTVTNSSPPIPQTETAFVGTSQSAQTALTVWTSFVPTDPNPSVFSVPSTCR